MFHIYYNALGVLYQRTSLPTAFRTTRLFLPSAFRAEGLLCLRLFARQDFECLRRSAQKAFFDWEKLRTETKGCCGPLSFASPGLISPSGIHLQCADDSALRLTKRDRRFGALLSSTPITEGQSIPVGVRYSSGQRGHNS